MNAYAGLKLIFFPHWLPFILCQKIYNITAGQILQTSFWSLQYTTIYHVLLFHLPRGTPVIQRTPGGHKPKKKHSAPLTLKMEVIPALHISLRVRRQGHAGAAQRNTSTLVQKLSCTALIDYCKGATVALAHGCTSYVAAECSHLVSREWNHAPGKSRL